MNNLIIKTTPGFERKAKRLLTSEMLEELYDHLETNPESGDVIQGTGGVRKRRWGNGKNNRGKRGGARILYHYSKDILVLLITIYNKSEKENITQTERNDLKRLMPKLITQYREGL